MGSKCLLTKAESTKQWAEPESTKAETMGVLNDSREMEGMRVLGSERVDALRQISMRAQSESTQSPGCVEVCGLQTSFPTLKDQEQRLQEQLLWL